MEIRKADYSSPQGQKDFVESLHETGFAVVTNHPIKKELIDRVYEDWKGFFNSDYKYEYKFKPNDQSGYFPFGTEHAKDSDKKDLKEFYHIYEGKKFPSELGNHSWDLYRELLSLGRKLLSWIYELSPEEVRKNFEMPLDEMSRRGGSNLFRIIYYPPLDGSEQEGEIRAAAHEDINLITLLPASTDSGLQVLSSDGSWLEIPGGYGDIVVNVGDMLQMASNAYYKSTTHRVMNPVGKAARRARFSMPLFVHPASEVKLSEDYTAGQYLDQRLKEIGLI